MSHSCFILDVSSDLTSLCDLHADNFITGPIPGNLSLLTKLIAIDLSFNFFSGELPPLLLNHSTLRAFKAVRHWALSCQQLADALHLVAALFALITSLAKMPSL